MTAYRVQVSDRAEADGEAAFLYLLRLAPPYAPVWYAGLRRAIDDLPGVLGPRAHAIDEEASELYSMEVRRALYFGPTRRRSGVPYRILFRILDPVQGEDEGVLQVLRVLHGVRSLTKPEGESPEP